MIDSGTSSSSALDGRDPGFGNGRSGTGASSGTGRGRSVAPADGGASCAGVGGSLTGVAGWRRTGVGVSASSTADSARRASSRRKRPSFHFSDGSCARTIFQPRYVPHGAQAASWTVCAPVSMRSTDGGASAMFSVDA